MILMYLKLKATGLKHNWHLMNVKLEGRREKEGEERVHTRANSRASNLPTPYSKNSNYYVSENSLCKANIINRL